MGHGLKVHAHTEEHDSGWKELEKQLKIIREKNPYVMVGVLESTGGHKAKTTNGSGKDPATVAMVASVQEFGSAKRNIPERSFIRSTMAEKKEHFNQDTVKILDHIIEGEYTVEKGLKILGLSIQKEIKAKIKAITEPGLKPSTIAAKGSDKPLIDTGQLMASILSETVLDGDQSKGEGEISVGESE